MTIPEVEDQVVAILTSKNAVNYPHPHYPGKRIVGWAVDEGLIGLGTALLAVDEIQRRALRSNV